MQPPLKRGEEVELEVGSAAFSTQGEFSAAGTSVARHNGFVVFVEGAVPGDLVRATVVRVKKNFAEARVTEVLRPSPSRTQARCVHFGVCGGCRWQHVEYQTQLRFKQQHVVDAFERIGGFQAPTVLSILGAKEQFFYRNKMEFSFSEREWKMEPPPPSSPHAEAPPVFLGLHVPQRYDKVLDIHECHLQSDLSNKILHFVRAFARRQKLPVYSSERNEGYWRFLVIRLSKRTQEVMVNLVTFEDRPELMRQFTHELVAAYPEITTVVNTINSKKAQVASGERVKVYHGTGAIRERLGGLMFEISAGSFFQTNTEQADLLYTVAGSFAELTPDDVVFDLYSGTGSIALFLSRSARRVVGIESVESAVNDARRNAQINAISNCDFILGDLRDRLTKDDAWRTEHPDPDVIVVDPPRSGMHPEVVQEIIRLQAGRIVYVSCNPATQARDIRMMCDASLGEKGYELVKLQPVDMFPHTYHVENVALLKRRGGNRAVENTTSASS